MKFPFFQRTRPASNALPPGVTLTAPTIPAPEDSAPSVPVGEIEALTGKIAALTAERDQANAALEAKAKEFADATAALETANGTIATLTGERDHWKTKAETDHEKIRQSVRNEELATLAAAQGIPAVEIVPVQGPGASKDEKINEALDRMKAATNPADRGRIAAELRRLREEKA